MTYQMPDEIKKYIIQVAYAGIEKGMGTKSKIIFDCLKQEYPNSAAGDIGYALIDIYSGNLSNAISLLNRTIKTSNNCLEEARVVLLFAMMLSGKNNEVKLKMDEFEKNNLVDSEVIDFTKSLIGTI